MQRNLVTLALLGSFLTGSPYLARAQEPVKAQPLIEAITKGDLQAAKDAIEKDPASVKPVGRNGYTPLALAVQQRNKDIVALLLDKGADPTSVLSNAIEMRNKEIIALLLDKGADVQQDYQPGYSYRSSGNTLLDRALNNNNSEGREIAAMLLAKGVDIEKRDREGKTILMRRTTSGGARENLEWLLEKGAKPNTRDDKGQSALDYAVMSGSADIVTLLLEKGADVKARDDNGRTALHAAVLRGNAPVVKAFLDKGADINAETDTGETALHIAAAAPGPLLNTLLSAGANANARNKRGDIPLHIALRVQGEPYAYGVPQITNNSSRYSSQQFSGEGVTSSVPAARADGLLLTLLDKSDISIKDGLGFSPLLLALSMRDIEARDIIIERKPKLDSTTELFDAVAQGDLITLEKILVAKPFLVYFRLPNGMTPLHISALWGTRGAAETLLKKGADVNARDAAGNSPLMMTTARSTGVFTKRARAMALLLLEKGADINARDRNDATALHRATVLRDDELMSLLLEKNADVNARDKTGNAPLHLLATGGATDAIAETALAKRLLEAKANPNVRNISGNTPLTLAVSARRVDFARLLCDKGARVDMRDNSGTTPLSRVVSLSGNSYSSEGSGNAAMKELAVLLLDKGADPNTSSDNSGESLLSRAVSNGSKDMVTLLLAKKVNLEAKNSSGYTPLLQAVSNGNNNQKEIVDLLLAAGANVNAKAPGEDTVLKLAKRYNNKEIIAALEAKGAKDDTPVVVPAAVIPRTINQVGFQNTEYGRNRPYSHIDCAHKRG